MCAALDRVPESMNVFKSTPVDSFSVAFVSKRHSFTRAVSRTLHSAFLTKGPSICAHSLRDVLEQGVLKYRELAVPSQEVRNG